MKCCRTAPRLVLMLVSLLALCLPMAAAGQDRGEGKLDPSQPQGTTVDAIVQQFAAKEKQFKIARDNYTYTQDVKIQTLDGETVDGEYHQVSDVLFDDSSRRIEQVVFAPQSSLQRVVMTQADYDDIRNRLPFVLTSDDIGKYQVLYVGKQKEDELGTYVFDIAPKAIEKGERYFQGRIWVDDHDFQIVKTYGETVPQVHNPQASGEGKSLAEVHHLARTNRRQVLVPHLHLCRGHAALLRRRRCQDAVRGEVQELQTLRCEVEDHVRGPGNSEGRRAAIGTTAEQHNRVTEEVRKAAIST